MRRILLVILILATLIWTVDAAEQYSFQNYADFIMHIGVDEYHYNGYWYGNGYVEYTRNTTGGNSYMHSYGYTWCGGGFDAFIVNSDPVPMSYFAASWLGGYGWEDSWRSQPPTVKLRFYDVARQPMAGDFWVGINRVGPRFPYRIEAKIMGGTAFIFRDGVLMGNTTWFNQYPSYIGISTGQGSSECTATGGGDIDDIVWGSAQPYLDVTGDKYVLSMPEAGYYFIMKDIMNPAASGFYTVNLTNPNGTPVLLTSYYLPTWYSKSNNNNETVYLNNYGGGDYQRYYTGSGNRTWTQKINWNLTEFFETAAPYGLYTTRIEGAMGHVETIPYIGSGAVISFDKDQYVIGETAVLTATVTDGYYDTAKYSYQVEVQDIYGNIATTQLISFNSYSPHVGSVAFTWSGALTEGLYYGSISAVPKTGADKIMMNFDVAELTTGVILTGYIKDAQTTLGLAEATILITQGNASSELFSFIPYGNYTSTRWAINDTITVNVTRDDYYPDEVSFSPTEYGLVHLNISLVPRGLLYRGVTVMGVAKEPPFFTTVDNATIDITNATTGVSYKVHTNSAGFYIQNYLRNNTVFDIWGSKEGFTNSTVYKKLVLGFLDFFS